MITRIMQLFDEWKSSQPLKLVDQKRLEEKFRLEFNYNSNHLEGNTLTYGQTKLLLFFGQTEGSHELREYEEMKAHDVALKMIIEEAKDLQRPLTENFIRTLNQTILVRPFWKDAQTPDGQQTRMEVKVGEYKSRQNSVQTATGEVFHYASEAETPAMMKDLVDWYNMETAKAELTPLEIATLLHYRYIRIHPFEDGNGRVARLLVNYVLCRYDYPFIIIKSKDKNNYLRILHRCDVEVGLEPVQGATASLEKIQVFVEYMTEQLEHSLSISIKAAKGENIEEDEDFEKKLTLLQRKLKQSEEVKPSFKSDYVWEIIENFYIPFDKLFVNSIEPIKMLYKNFTTFGEVHGKKFDISDVLKLRIKEREVNNSKSIIGRLTKAVDKYDFLDPRFLKYRVIISNPINIKLKYLPLDFQLIIDFGVDDYSIEFLEDRIIYNYGQLPTEIDQKKIIDKYKQTALQKIESSI